MDRFLTPGGQNAANCYGQGLGDGDGEHRYLQP